MTPHTLNILLGLSTVGFVVVSLLYMVHLHDTKWKLLSKDIETEVVVRNNNRIDVVVSPNYNCTVEVTIRLTYDSFFPLYPWSVEVDLPPQKHMNDRRITEYADFLRKVGRVMDEIETLGNYKYRKV